MGGDLTTGAGTSAGKEKEFIFIFLGEQRTSFKG